MQNAGIGDEEMTSDSSVVSEEEVSRNDVSRRTVGPTVVPSQVPRQRLCIHPYHTFIVKDSATLLELRNLN